MCKVFFKLLVVTALLTGAFVLLGIGGGHVAADGLPNNCGPATDTGLPAVAYNGSSIIWGNDSDGEGSGVMSSLIMRARDQSGNALNPHFTINSEAPASPDDAQIYRWPIGSGGSVSNSDAWPQHGDFQFGTTMHNAGNPVQCNGWVVLGPGTQGHVGNGWVLNCKTNGQDNKFWISHIDNPGGQPGKWQMLNSSGGVIDNDVNAGGASIIKFPVTNGANMRFTFVWVPDTPPHGNPDVTSECSVLDVQDGGSATINGKNFSSDAIRTTVRVTDDSGQVMVHGSGGQGDPVILNNAHPPPGAGDWNPATGTGHWTYTPRSPTVHVIVHRQFWHNTGTKDSHGNWIWAWDNYQDDSRDHGNCYSASCWIDATGVAGNVPNGPGNAAVENSQFQVTVHMQNTGILTLGSPTVNNVGLAGGGYLNKGDVSYTSPPITVTAPGGVQNYRVTFSMRDGTFGNLGSCYVDVPIYTAFTLEPHAELNYATAENPGPITYDTYITNNSSAAAGAPTRSTFTYIPYGGGTSCPNAGPVNTSGPYSPGGPNYTISPSVCNPTRLNAGDQYCAEIDFTGGYNQGYVGPGGAIAPTGLTTPGAKRCLTIVNEPYYKAYNSVSAGGSFSSAGSCTGGGLLAGWNNNQGGADRGAGSTLSALALIKITGFASAQTSISRSPTALTFANTNAGDISSSAESPSLGGNYDPAGSHCLPTASPPSGTSYQAGPYTQSGIANFSGSKSLFVNGDVRITGNITYANNTAIANAPSFVLHATGNIYVDPGVTELNGEYISDKKIYTCNNAATGGNGFGPASPSNAPPSNMFTACRNQLLVRGSFIANQVNFARTFGSLRDETPTPGSPGSPGTPAGPWGVKWTHWQDSPYSSPPSLNSLQSAGYRCTYIEESSEPREHTWYDNYLCLPGSSSLRFAWTQFAGNPGVIGNWTNPTSGWAPLWVMQNGGYPYCIQWGGGDPDSWGDNYLCSNQNVNMRFTGAPDGRDCTAIMEPSDPYGQWSSGYWLCMDKQPGTPYVAPTPPAAPAHPTCSNAGGRSANSPVGSCAAEVFQYSPSLYISKPNIQPPNGGATQYDAITSLPPVL